MTEAAVSEVDWESWLWRWDRQQERYLADREKNLGRVLEVVERLVGEPDVLVDLGCGPGSLAARVARRFRRTRVIGVDLDPFLLELGSQAVGSGLMSCRGPMRSRRSCGITSGTAPRPTALQAKASRADVSRPTTRASVRRARVGGVVAGGSG